MTRHPSLAELLYLDLDELGVPASPVAVLDDFRVDGLPFTPHPHAGFAAVTYVFEDSLGDLRSRTSTGVVPVWRSDTGDGVRVVVGSFEDVSSPLVPIELFTFLDVRLRREISMAVPAGHNAVVYVLDGTVTVRAGDREETVGGKHALALRGNGEHLTLGASRPAHLLVLAGPEIRERVVAEGPFIMNERSQIDAARTRYHGGAMGRLTRLPES